MSSLTAKLVLAVTGAAFLFATPVDAAKRSHRTKAAAAHAKVKHRGVVRSDPLTVTFGPHTIGRDPDPNIRHQLYRDLSGFFGGDI
jgi:predicted secreted protein